MLWGCGTSRPEGGGRAQQARESRRRRRGAVWGKGLRRRRVWGGEGSGEGSPGERSGEGQCPSPENVLTLDLQMVTFGAFWWFFLQFSSMFYKQKLVLLGFQNLPLQFTVVFQADDNDWWSHKSSQPGVVDWLLPVVPSSCKLCMSVVEGSTDTPIAFIIIICMERHVCAIVLVVN